MIGPEPDEGFRYERKLEVAQMDPAQVRSIVLRHPVMFRPTYPPRWVNNIYLDTSGFEAYRDNSEGNPERAKARIRWYGDFSVPVSDGVLELKIKQGSVGSKLRFPMPSFVVDQQLSGAHLSTTVRNIDGLPPEARHVVARLSEATANRYRREYYLSSDGRFRATIDFGLRFASIGRRSGGIRISPAARPLVVVEVKYGREADTDADRVCSWFPFRVAKHSKYARGVEAAFGGSC